MAQLADGGRTPVASRPRASGNASNIANQAIQSYGNSRTVAPSSGGGLIRTPQQARATANPGSMTNPTRVGPPVNVNNGYEVGSFEDPTIDWGAIYNAMVAPGLSGGGGGGGAQTVSPGPAPMQMAPAVFQSPDQIAAPSAAPLPAVVTGSASGQAGDPTGASFEAFGSPSSFGGFERQRNQRGPMHNASMTPEMLRRAAASRLG